MTDCQFLGTLVDNKQNNKKAIQKIFKNKGLQIIIKCNLKQLTSMSNPAIPRISENTFTKRYANHKISFNINRYKNDTKLSVEYWNLKARNSNPKVTWAVKNQFSAYNPQSKRCSLCLNEKLEILEDKETNLLNKKSEIILKFRHQNKYMLRTLASKIQNPDVT